MTNAVRPPTVKIYSRIFARDPQITEFWIQGRQGPLKIRILTPKGSPHAPMIVLIHGFVQGGPRNHVMSLLAEGLCRSGLRVVMPYIESEEEFRIDPTAVDEVDDVVRWSAVTSGEKVSLFGISFSGGLVISAAATSKYADYVKMVFCVSGYNSIDRVGRYYVHDEIEGPDSRPYVGTPPPYAHASMAMQYLDELVPPEDVGPLRAVIQAMFAQTGSVNKDAMSSLTKRQRVLLDDVLNARTPQMRARYHAVLEHHRAELAYISPMGKINGVHGSLYVLHGKVDDIIPSVEAEWTRAEALHKRNVEVVITPWMHHATLAPFAPFREKIRVVYFVSKVLDEALHPVPLQRSKG